MGREERESVTGSQRYEKLTNFIDLNFVYSTVKKTTEILSEIFKKDYKTILKAKIIQKSSQFLGRFKRSS